MPVIYNGNDIRPGPQVSFTKDRELAGDGRIIGTTVHIQLQGTLVADVDFETANPHATLAKLGVLIAKQKVLRDIFSENGHLLEVQGWDGSTPVKVAAIVDSLEFQAGPWVDKCDYTVTLHGEDFADVDRGPDPQCSSASENWQFEEAEVPYTWKATHTLSAKGKLVYDGNGVVTTPPWELAKHFVTDQLGLDWETTTPVWSPTSGEQLVPGSAAHPQTATAWNHAVVETIDELEGSYSVTETWLLSANPYTEKYTISVRKVDDQPNLTVVAALQGNIQGLYVNQGDYATRYLNALAAWGTTSSLLKGRADAASGLTLNIHPSGAEVEHNPVDGTVSYTYQFDNRTLINDAWETYSVIQKRSIEDFKTTVTVQGSIQGVLYMDVDTNPAIKFTRAAARWAVVKPMVFARAVNASGVTDLKALPITAEVQEEPITGVVTYTYEFDNRPSLLASEEFTVSRRYSREDGKTTIALTGTIKGFPTVTGNDPFDPTQDIYSRYNNAVAYFNAKEPNLLGVAALYTQTGDVYPTAYLKSVSHTPLGGTVAYEYEFTTGIVCFPGALSEAVTVTDDDAVPLFAEIPVIGRAAGPVIQDMGTVSPRKRQVAVELIFPPATACGFQPAPTYDISQYVPSGSTVMKTQDQVTWSYRLGHYSRIVSWTYLS